MLREAARYVTRNVARRVRRWSSIYDPGNRAARGESDELSALANVSSLVTPRYVRAARIEVGILALAGNVLVRIEYPPFADRGVVAIDRGYELTFVLRINQVGVTANPGCGLTKDGLAGCDGTGNADGSAVVPKPGGGR